MKETRVVILRKEGIAVKIKDGYLYKHDKILWQLFDKDTTEFLLNCLRVYRTSVMFFRDMSIDVFFEKWKNTQDDKIN